MHRTRSIFRIPPHAQDQEHQNGTYAAGLPGICDVNLVSHTMGDGTSSVALSMAHRQLRGRAASLSPKSRPKVHLPARSAPLLGEIRSPQRAQHAKRTGLSMTDASHRMDKPAPQSVALYLPPFSHTGSLPSARTPSSPQNSDPRQLSRRTFSFDNSLGSEAVVEGCKLGFQLCKVGFEGVK